MGISTQSPRWGSVMNGSYAKWLRSLKQPFINFYNWSRPAGVVIQWLLPCESIIMFSTCTLLTYIYQPTTSLEVRYTVLPMLFRATPTRPYMYVPYSMRLYTYHIQWDYIHIIYNETIYVPYTLRPYMYHNTMRLYIYVPYTMRLYTYHIQWDYIHVICNGQLSSLVTFVIGKSQSQITYVRMTSIISHSCALSNEWYTHTTHAHTCCLYIFQDAKD